MKKLVETEETEYCESCGRLIPLSEYYSNNGYCTYCAEELRNKKYQRKKDKKRKSSRDYDDDYYD